MRIRSFSLGIIALLIVPFMGLFGGNVPSRSAPPDIGVFARAYLNKMAWEIPVAKESDGKRPWLNPARAAL